jgi:mannose-6-phosphate isomerase-like protein (cupin superfamily)
MLAPAFDPRFMKKKQAVVKQKEDVKAVPCPCGQATRIMTKADGAPMSFHVVSIKKDSELHYHKKLTEIYHVLKGKGSIYLDGKIVKLGVGSTVLIPPGVKHRAIGKMEIINTVYPPFDPSDEYIVHEPELATAAK